MFMQNFGEQTKSTMVFLKVAYGKWTISLVYVSKPLVYLITAIMEFSHIFVILRTNNCDLDIFARHQPPFPVFLEFQCTLLLTVISRQTHKFLDFFHCFGHFSGFILSDICRNNTRIILGFNASWGTVKMLHPFVAGNNETRIRPTPRHRRRLRG